MLPNNNNLTSAWHRQMQRLRRQVDQIDLKMLQLLQQRTKLSGEIGRMKRRHGATIYVPEREHELVVRLTRQSRGRLPDGTIAALYREILSSSRAAQRQAPIGLLQGSAALVLPASRGSFGACDQFSPQKTWRELTRRLDSEELSLALLTGDDLMAALQSPRMRNEFLRRLTVVGDFASALDLRVPLARRIFIVTPGGKGASGEADRILILIECKSTVNAIKSLLHSMPDMLLQTEQLTRRPASTRGGTALTLVRLRLARPIDAIQATRHLLAAGKSSNLLISILGVYPGTEDHGG